MILDIYVRWFKDSANQPLRSVPCFDAEEFTATGTFRKHCASPVHHLHYSCAATAGKITANHRRAKRLEAKVPDGRRIMSSLPKKQGYFCF